MLVASFFLFSVGYAQNAFEKSAAASLAACQPFKDRSLTVVVPFRAGGGFDLDARAFKPFLQRHSQMEVSVVNMPGASGMLAARAVADASASKLTVGMLDPRLIAAAPFDGMDGPDIAAFAALGSLGVQNGVWLSQRPVDWAQISNKRLTASAGGEGLARITLASAALGLNVVGVSGYQSTNEAWLASQRGEIDIVVGAKDNAERFIKSMPQATISLILSAEPDPEYPGVPYLAGPGGLADRLSKTASSSERSKRMTLASIAVLGSPTNRMILASAKMPIAVQRCLSAATEASLLDPERATSAHVLASNFAPQSVAAAAQMLKRLQEELGKHRELVAETVKLASQRR